MPSRRGLAILHIGGRGSGGDCGELHIGRVLGLELSRPGRRGAALGVADDAAGPSPGSSLGSSARAQRIESSTFGPSARPTMYA